MQYRVENRNLHPIVLAPEVDDDGTPKAETEVRIPSGLRSGTDITPGLYPAEGAVSKHEGEAIRKRLGNMMNDRLRLVPVA